MSTKKVSELTGAELDFLVARAAGLDARVTDANWRGWHGSSLVIGSHCVIEGAVFAPTTEWVQGGPIIEREQISIIRMGGPPGFWMAGFDPECDQGSQCESGWIELPAIEMRHQHSGPTPLIAAMRAYVASKFGEEVPDA